MIEVKKDMSLLYDTWGQGRRNAIQYKKWGILQVKYIKRLVPLLY